MGYVASLEWEMVQCVTLRFQGNGPYVLEHGENHVEVRERVKWVKWSGKIS